MYPKLQIEEEALIDDFLKVDILIPDHKLVVEVNGPTHFNGLGQLNKKTQTKRRVLEALGYRYASVNKLNWGILDHQKREKQLQEIVQPTKGSFLAPAARAF